MHHPLKYLVMEKRALIIPTIINTLYSYVSFLMTHQQLLLLSNNFKKSTGLACNLFENVLHTEIVPLKFLYLF